MRSDSPGTRLRSRRDVLKLGAAIAGGGVLAPLLAACGRPSGGSNDPSPIGSGGSPGLTGPITVLHGGGDPAAEPALGKVYDDFKALNPGIEWDIRALPGSGSEFDRLARAAVAAGEPVGLLVMDGQQIGGWAHDGLLADLGADPDLATVLARVPQQFHLAGPGETATRAFPLAVTRGVNTTGLFYNKALLDRASLEAPKTIADLKASVAPLAALGVAPLVHCSGDVFFNTMLVTWLLPMIAERTGDPLEFAGRVIRGEVRYDSPEWLEAFQTIADFRSSGVLLAGSGATDYATMQQLFLRGKAAMTYQGTWLLEPILAGSPVGDFDLHVAPPPLVDGALRPRPLLAWGGFALPAESARSRDSVYAFLEYASRPDVDAAVVRSAQVYSPIPESNAGLENAIAQEFLPMFSDAITPFDWLWEPEITAEVDSQVQAIVRGDTEAAAGAKAIQSVAEELRRTGRSYYP